MSILWQAPSTVCALVGDTQKKYHTHLDQAKIAVGFVDTKPFIHDQFNWGKVVKFTKAAKLWHGDKKYDFCIFLCADAWHNLLNAKQQQALGDLHLSRCKIKYEPVREKGRIIRDEWGRIEYTNDVKYDDDGVPFWKLLPLDIGVFAENVKRFGLWCDDLVNFQHAIDQSSKVEVIVQ